MRIAAHLEAGGTNVTVGGFDGAAVGGFQEAFADASDFALASPQEAGGASAGGCRRYRDYTSLAGVALCSLRNGTAALWSFGRATAAGFAGDLRGI
jgi:hypothetical protein